MLDYEREPMNIALLGFGTVGRGVDQIIATRVPDIAVTRILELPNRICDERMTSNFADIVGDEDIELVVECMGGIEPAHTFIAEALRAGKHVVTSNKAVIAAHFAEFAQLAREHDVAFLIEASVGGGIPWIASIEKARRVDEVQSFWGIMNGTTNFVIDSMRKEGLDFHVALSQAQELGYAERDPSADIDGIDVANKTIITACVSFDVDCARDLPVTGIATLQAADIVALAERGLTVKLFGRGVQRDGAYAVAVEPVAVPVDSLEASVPTNFNLMSFVGTTVDELKFYGQGAGSLPTGNAIVQDIIDAHGGKRPCYDFSRALTYDPALLAGDYVYRSSMAPQGSERWAQGYWLVRNQTPVEARALLEQLWTEDASAFMVALPQEG